MNVDRILGVDVGKVLILFSVLFSLLSSTVLATDIDSTFSCHNVHAQTTFYSYLKSPGLDESQYSRGLKTGTLDYYNGDKADLTDKLVYYDGTNPDPLADHNASVNHTLTVDFSGKNNTSRGVSQFYAQGFYTNNRVVSASKKFWFNNQTYYQTNNISARATGKMSLKGTYDLKYTASANNAFFTFNDATGFINKTGARKTDWEQEGLLKGDKLSVTNNLRVSGPFIPRAGGDWLPCTCLSTDPMNLPDLGAWPSPEAFSILQPINSMLLPPNCNGASCRGVKNWRSAGSLLYLDTPSGVVEGMQSSATSLVQAISSWKPDDVDNSIADYTIEVSNMGNIVANNVVLALKLSDNLTYIGGSASIDSISQDPYRPYNNNSLFWYIGDISVGSDQAKTLKLQAIAKSGSKAIQDKDPDKSIVTVIYKGGVSTKQSMTDSSGFSSSLPLEVDSYIEPATDQLTHYRILVINQGTIDATNVTLIDTLADGMEYQKGATIDYRSGNTSEPEISDDKHTLTWHLGTLLAIATPDGKKRIEFSVKMANTTDPTENIAYAKYQIGSNNINTPKVKSTQGSNPNLPT